MFAHKDVFGSLDEFGSLDVIGLLNRPRKTWATHPDPTVPGVRLALNGAVACSAKSKRTKSLCRQAAIKYTTRCRFHCGMTLERARQVRDTKILYAAWRATKRGDGFEADRLLAMLPPVDYDELARLEDELDRVTLDLDLLNEPIDLDALFDVDLSDLDAFLQGLGDVPPEAG